MLALILCTTPTPMLCLAAILWMPCLPCCNALAMAASTAAGMRDRVELGDGFVRRLDEQMDDLATSLS